MFYAVYNSEVFQEVHHFTPQFLEFIEAAKVSDCSDKGILILILIKFNLFSLFYFVLA